jgi:hypothetical protein
MAEVAVAEASETALEMTEEMLEETAEGLTVCV